MIRDMTEALTENFERPAQKTIGTGVKELSCKNSMSPLAARFLPKRRAWSQLSPAEDSTGIITQHNPNEKWRSLHGQA